MMMNRLPDRDQRRQRVADHGQLQRAENLMRQRRQLERQPHHMLPAIRTEPPAERQRHEDRHRKRAVLSVATRDGSGSAWGAHASRVLVAASRRDELSLPCRISGAVTAIAALSEVRAGGTPAPARETRALPGGSALARASHAAAFATVAAYSPSAPAAPNAAQPSAVVLMLLLLFTVSPQPPSAF